MKKLPLIAKLPAALALMTVLASCAMFSGRETPGQYVDDSTITSSVKAEILADPKLKVLQINVETMQGIVQLSGFVDSERNEAQAVALTRRVDGVKSVQDNLIVR